MKLPDSITLPMWAGYRAGPRAPASTGTIAVDSHGSRPTPRQADALAATQKRAARLMPAILDAIVAGYGGLREWKKRPKASVTFGGDEGDATEIEPAQEATYRRVIKGAAATQRAVLDAIATALPEVVSDRKALPNQLELVAVHIHSVERDGIAYVGYELTCAWDGEHGVGVLTHGDRVVEVGQADTSFLTWVAERASKKKTKKSPKNKLLR